MLSSGIDCFSLWQNFEKYPFPPHKIVSIVFFFLVGDVVCSCFMLCRFISGLKRWNQFLSPVTMLWRQHIVPSTTKIFFKLVALSQKPRNQTGTNFPVSQASHLILDITLLYSSLCCHFPVTPQFSLINSLISPSFLVVWAFRGLTGAVCVPVFTRFYLTSDTASAHAGVFVWPLKSCICMRSADCNKEAHYSALPKWRVHPCRFFALIHDHVAGVDYLIFIVVWGDIRNWSSRMAQCIIYTCSCEYDLQHSDTYNGTRIRCKSTQQLFVIPHCSWRLVWPSCMQYHISVTGKHSMIKTNALVALKKESSCFWEPENILPKLVASKSKYEACF